MTLRAGCAWFAAAVLGLGLAACGERSQPSAQTAVATRPPAPETVAPIDRAPLAGPLRVTSGYGEYRGGHYHAGLDFSTDRVVGKPVLAPFDGWVERIRGSGGGFGRALYLRAADGRTALVAHLDAFDGAHGAFLAAVQESTGRYEQDLMLDSLRFAVRAGERIAWSGESGAGPPHLHFELRHGDMSYHPARFGLATRDSIAPVIRALVVEPLDDASFVARGQAPRRTIASPRETLVVEGRVRVWVDGRDPGSAGARLAVYAATLADGADTVEVRFDRVAWDADMTSVEWQYDGTGRVAGGRPLALWASPTYRSPVVVTPARAEGGTLTFAPGDPARAVHVSVRDLAGHVARRTLWLRGPRADERGVDTARVSPASRAARATFGFTPVRDGFVRVAIAGAPGASRGVTLGWEGGAAVPASLAGARWTAILPWPRPGRTRIAAEGRAAGVPWRREQELTVAVAGSDGGRLELGDAFAWQAPAGGSFEPALIVAPPRDSTLPLAVGLVALTPAHHLEPLTLPLRTAARVSLRAPEQWRDDPRAGLYHRRGGGWNWVAPASRDGGRIAGDVRALGSFALFADTVAPVIGLARVRAGLAGPYSRWSLAIGASDRGSGVNGAECVLTIDGARVPVEWDGEHATLRWRPRTRPARGTHRWELAVVDRTGNVRRKSGTFVLR